MFLNILHIKKNALREMWRVLKPDGILIVIVPNFVERIYNLRYFPSMHGEYDSWFDEFKSQLPANWLKLVKNEGFDISKVFTTRFSFLETPRFRSILSAYKKTKKWLDYWEKHHHFINGA